MISMKDAQFDDLKQFILAVAAQSEANMKQCVQEYVQSELSELSKQIGELRTEMRQGFALIADIITGIHDDIDGHERRITRIERKLA